jgi:DnaJ-class molecular chaperone
MNLIPCAFCKGKGRDPFNLLSELSTCQVCGGTGKVKITEPAINCAYCKGTGIYPHSVRITCTVCSGKGSVTVAGVTEECPKCKGTAEAIDSGLPCIKCGGKGVILKR